MTRRPTVEHVVAEACGFGQEDDDITVVSVTRSTVSQPRIVIRLSPRLAPS
jgi:hypothetical protein